MNKLQHTKLVVKELSESIPIIDRGFGIVSHPLIANMHFFDEQKGLVAIDDKNKEYALRQRLGIIEKCTNIAKILFNINKPYRLYVLILISDLLSEKNFNKHLRWIWTSTEYPHQNRSKDLLKLFEKSNRELIMNKKEKDVFKALSDVVAIYRGTQSNKAKIRGFSWTLDKEKAIWFSKRFKLNGKVYQAEILKWDIFFYNNGRSEEEVVVNPYKLKNVKEVSI